MGQILNFVVSSMAAVFKVTLIIQVGVSYHWPWISLVQATEFKVRPCHKTYEVKVGQLP